MNGFDDQSWVTLVLSEIEVWQSLVLAKSLKNTLTAKKITVLVCENIETSFRDLLKNIFDFVLPIETNKYLKNGIDRNQVAKLWCCKLKAWNSCIFLPPNMMALKNCDVLFNLRETSGTSDKILKHINPNIFGVRSSLSIFYKCESLLNEAATSMDGEKRILMDQVIDALNSASYSPRLSQPIQVKNGALLKSEWNTNDGILFEMNNVVWKNMEGNYPAEDFAVQWRQVFLHDIIRLVENENNSQNQTRLSNSILANNLPKPCETSNPRIDPLSDDDNDYKDGIAIIGMSCRFAGANNPAEFWNVLKEGISGICDYPADRPRAIVCGDGTSAPIKAGYLKCPVDEFDAKFFRISPKEAPFIDPQQRLLLEVAWEAIENAGINPTSLKGTNTSAYLGIWQQDYDLIFPMDGLTGNEFHHRYLGNAISASSARLSYFLGLHGPNIAVESGCSSSLAGIHLACENLRKGESNLAISSGINLILTSSNPLSGNADTLVFSKDSLCKTFDASADGFVRAEGCGVLILKRFDDALANGDNILAVIRGSAYNNDGTGTSFGTPNPIGQTRVIHEALANAKINAQEVSYVEAHGTGTAVGDPTEMYAISQGYSTSTPRIEPLLVGSVKTNIGHAESCAGMAGVIKVILSMQNKAIPPHLNFKTLNPLINLNQLPAKIPTELTEWKESKKIAGVSSFSMSGTNVHILIQEPPKLRIKSLNTTFPPSQNQQLFTISAKTEDALDELCKKYAEFLEKNPNINFSDIIYLVNTGRAHFSHGSAIIAKNCEDLAKKLKGRNGLGIISGKASSSSQKPKIAFVFTGQGSQYIGMARRLYELSPAFHQALDTCDFSFKKYFGISILQVMWAEKEDELTLLTQSIYCQPTIFCIQYALVQHWSSFGIRPDLVLGHSVGEFCAAVSAGILSFEHAMKLVVARSRLVEAKVDGGTMLVVQQSLAKVNQLITQFCSAHAHADRWVDIAAINSPNEVVVSTSNDTAKEFVRFCTSVGITTLPISSSHAFHSRATDCIMEEFGNVAKSVTHHQNGNNCKYVSGTLARVMEGKDFSSEYWVRHLRETVKFADAVQIVCSECKIFLEIGTQPILLGLTMANLHDTTGGVFCPSLRRNEDDWSTSLNTLSKLYVSGIDIEWSNWYGATRAKGPLTQILPTYPFQRQKYWYENKDSGIDGIGGITSNTRLLHPMLGRQMPAPIAQKIFFNTLRLNTLPFIEDHKVAEKVIIPAAGYLEIIMAAGFQVIQGGAKVLVPITIEDFQIEAALCLDSPANIQTMVEPQVPEQEQEISASTGVKFRVSIFKQVDFANPDKWKRHAIATCGPSTNLHQSASSELLALEEIQDRLEPKDQGSVTELYTQLASVGITFGPRFQSITSAWYGTNEILTKINLPQDCLAICDSYICHPILLDAMIQTFAFRQNMLNLNGEQQKQLYLPISIKKFTWLSRSTSTLQQGEGSTTFFAYSKFIQDESKVEEEMVKDFTIHLYNEVGEPLAIMEGVDMVATNVTSFLRAIRTDLQILPEFFKEIWRPALPVASARVNLDNWKVPTKTQDFPTVLKIIEEFCAIELPPYRLADRIIFVYWLKGIQECGWFWPSKVGDRVKAEDWITPMTKKTLHCGFIQSFYNTMIKEGYIDSSTSKILKLLPTTEEATQMIKDLNTKYLDVHGDHVTLELMEKCGQNIPNILNGKTTGLALLFPEDGSADVGALRYYHESNLYKFSNKFITEVITEDIKRLNISAGESGVLRLLEVGAGSGTTTMHVVQQLTQLGIPHQYTYTDISPLLVSHAKEQLDKNIICSVFNVEEDPLSQGFVPHAYDIVIGAHVLHATRDLEESLANIDILLKDGGIIFLGEQLKDVYKYSLTFGLLEGWWRFNDFRKFGPMIDENVWGTLLNKSGFDHVTTFKLMDDTFAAIRGRKEIGVGLPMRMRTLMPENRKTWFVFSDSSQNPNICALTEKLVNVNRKVVTVIVSTSEKQRSEVTSNQGQTQFQLPGNATLDNIKSVFESSLYHDGKAMDSLEGVLFLHTGRSMPDTQNQDNHNIIQILLHVCQTVVTLTSKSKQKPKILLVTQGVHYIGDAAIGDPIQAPGWGLLKTFGNENPDIPICLIDLDPSDDANIEPLAATELFAQFWPMDREQYIALRSGGKKFQQRLSYMEKSLQGINFPNVNRFEVINPSSGAFSDLDVGPAVQAQEVAEDLVEINVEACGLNFRDLLVILKPEGFKLPEGQVWEIGLEVSGIVTSIGPGCKRLAIGDAVFGFASHTGLGSHLIGSEKGFMRKPAQMSFTGAATLPVGFGTAYYALIGLAKIQSTDRVLIHVASGGVGLAAVQIAQRAGAQIYATAGSHRKRAYLRSLGIANVYHSRNTDYGEKILKDSGGDGVTIVLNSLTGPNFKEESLRACAQGAKFIEIGKINTWTAKDVSLLRPDVKYEIFDLGTILMENPEEAQKLCQALETNFHSNIYTALPHSIFALEQCRQAFYYFQEAKHIGKIVVKIPKPIISPQGGLVLKSFLFSKESTYLITGGLGGLGMEVAQWMLSEGAGHIVLVGRNPPSKLAQNLIDGWNSVTKNEYQDTKNEYQDTKRVIAMQTDVSSYQECFDLLNKIKNIGLAPLRGIIHAAGILSDGMIMNQTWESFESVFKPKVYGGWNLHELTKNGKDYNLEFFIMFSTAGVIAGAVGQSNHVAANFYLDSLAHHRVAMGLPGTTINWGAWSDVGAAAHIKLGVEGVIGIRAFSPAQGIAALDNIFRERYTRAVVLDISDWNLFKGVFSHGHYMDEINILNSSSAQQDKLEDYKKFVAEIKTLPQEEWQGKFEEFLARVLRQTLRLPENDAIDPDQNFSELGVDSLMAMEMRNRLQGVLEGKTLTVAALQENRTIRSLSAHLVSLLTSDSLPLLPGIPLDQLLIQDSILPSDILIETDNLPPLMPSQFKNILLTGATGHLGSNILAELINWKSAAADLKIRCLIRAKDEAEGHSKLLATLKKQQLLESTSSSLDRVTIVVGDISKPNLGLNVNDYEELCQNIDAIIHCAAKSNHLENYDETGGQLRLTNVQGVINILRFAVAKKTKPLFHASSLLAASEFSPIDGMLSEDFPNPAMIGTEIQNGYSQSKFVGEKLIAAGMNVGIPTTVIRFPAVLGNSITGIMPVEFDHVWIFFLTCIKLQKFPQFPQGISMVPVDIAARISLMIFLNDKTEKGMYNLTTETNASEDVLKDLALEFKFNLTFVPFTQWREEVFGLGDNTGALSIFMDVYTDKSNESREITAHPLATHLAQVNFCTISKKMERNIENVGNILPPAKDILQRHLSVHFSSGNKNPDDDDDDDMEVEIGELAAHMLA